MFKDKIIFGLFFCVCLSCKVSNHTYLSMLYHKYYIEKKDDINFELIEKRCREYFKKENRPEIWEFGSFQITDTSFIVGIKATKNSNIDEQIILDNFLYKVVSHQVCTFGCYPLSEKMISSPYNRKNYNNIKKRIN